MTSRISKASIFAIYKNDVSISKASTFVILDGSPEPKRRTMVTVNHILIPDEPEITWEYLVEDTFLNSYVDGYEGSTIRQRIEPAALTIDGDYIRIKFQGYLNGLKIDKVSIGYATTGFSFDTTPTPVLFSGSRSIDIGSLAQITCDPIHLPYESGKGLVIAFHFAAGGDKGTQYRNEVINNWSACFLNGTDDVDTVSAVGYTASGGRAINIRSIEYGTA